MTPDDGLENSAYLTEAIKKDEIDSVVQMIRENMESFQEAGSVLAATYRRLNQFYTVYHAKGACYLVIKNQQSQIIGGAGIGAFAGLSPTEKIGEIRELVIAPESRGKGAGRVILRSCIDEAVRMGYERIYLETTPQMRQAQRLFTSFGFVPVSFGAESGSQDPDTLPYYFMLDRTKS